VGYRLDPFGSGKVKWHNGTDISVPAGTSVYAVESGTVYFAGPWDGYGNLVAVVHEGGYVTMYGHLSRLLARPGEQVTDRSVIALSGNTGRSTGPHLHFESRWLPGYGKDTSPPVVGTAPLMVVSSPPVASAAPSGPKPEVQEGGAPADDWVQLYIDEAGKRGQVRVEDWGGMFLPGEGGE
jgi:murein DD-endopeptidase MepM/ murein hydrolase activator NlpD